MSIYLLIGIFNADETALLYNLLTNKTLQFKGNICVGGKSNKEWIIALVCENMYGIEKLKLIKTGISKIPKCFTGINILLLDYVSSTKALMTGDIFSN